MRLVALSLALILAGVGVFTILEIPAGVNWKLAILAGEYGHWLAVPAVLTGLYAACRGPNASRGAAHPRRRTWVTGLTLVASVAGATLLLHPALAARRIARDLPARFAAAGWRVDVGPEPLRWSQLFLPRRSALPVEAFTPPGGLPFDFYRAPAPAPCVIVIHAGGWDGGDRRQFESFHRALAESGIAVAAVSYRLAPKWRWPAQAEDIRQVLNHLKTNERAYGIDARRFVLLGRSAGGHIAEAFAYREQDPAIRGVVAFYAPADLEFAWIGGHVDKVLDSLLLMTQLIGARYPEAPDAYRAASGYFHVSAHTPPTLLMHGALDPIVWHRQSERLNARLTEHNVPNVFVSLPWATHAFDYTVHGPGGQLALWSVRNFVATVAR